jgi:hypothetical protein
MDLYGFLQIVAPAAMERNFNGFFWATFFVACVTAVLSIYWIKTDHQISLLLLYSSASVGSFLFTLSFVSLIDLFTDNGLPRWYTTCNVIIVICISSVIQSFVTGKNAPANRDLVSRSHLWSDEKKRAWYPFQQEDLRFQSHGSYTSKKGQDTVTHEFNEAFDRDGNRVVEIRETRIGPDGTKTERVVKGDRAIRLLRQEMGGNVNFEDQFDRAMNNGIDRALAIEQLGEEGVQAGAQVVQAGAGAAVGGATAVVSGAGDVVKTTAHVVQDGAGAVVSGASDAVANPAGALQGLGGLALDTAGAVAEGASEVVATPAKQFGTEGFAGLFGGPKASAPAADRADDPRLRI